MKTPAAHGSLALVLHQGRFDLRSFLRNRQARFFTLVLPLLFLVIFNGVFGGNLVGGAGLPAKLYYVPGISRPRSSTSSSRSRFCARRGS